MKRILFVDDDASVLDGLRVRLHALRGRWHMVFVESAGRALAEMEYEAFDVIVADLQMPGMDGAALLAEVARRWPETIRIVLSGCAGEGHALPLVGLAQQYVSKPCDATILESVIERSVRLHEVLRTPGLRALAGRIGQLPALPATYSRLRDAMARPDTSVRELAAIVYEDPAVAAKLLQLVNSSFFRTARRISRIDQAISHLGLNAVRTLVLSVEAFALWRVHAPPAGLEPARLQERAHVIATAAHALLEDTPLADDALLAGLFHNLGYWILLQQCAVQLHEAVALSRTEKITMHEAEHRVLGASHAEVGAYLLGLWGLPHPVIEAVAFQHCPQRAAQTEFDVLAALATALALHAQESDAQAGLLEHAEAPIDDEYLQSLKAPFDWAEARQRVLNAHGTSPP